MDIRYRSYAIFSRDATSKTIAWRKRMEEHLREHYSHLLLVSLETADLILTIGGDGTLLRVLRSNLLPSAHILAFNTGHVGFLCSVQMESQFLEALSLALEGRLLSMPLPIMRIRHRSVDKLQEFAVVNDLLFERTMTWIQLRADIVHGENIHHLKILRASGICVTSPLGSTTAMATHLNAPIMDPMLKTLYLKGINDQSAPRSGLMINLNHQCLRIRIVRMEQNPGIPSTLHGPLPLFGDGLHLTMLSEGDELHIDFYSAKKTLLRLYDDTHWDRLRALRF